MRTISKSLHPSVSLFVFLMCFVFNLPLHVAASIRRRQELIEVHERFLQKLKETNVNARYRLSHVFLEFRESFLIYGDYCANMTRATDMLREVTKKNGMVDQLVQVSNALR